MTQHLESMKKKILTDSPRMRDSDSFCFACNPGVSCFTKCCRDVGIVLTPYDVLRLRRKLQLSSQDFIDQYILLPPVAATQVLPTPYLKMRDEEERRCPFVSEAGCSVYEDRPWACRMYPIGIAASRSAATPDGEDFFFVMKDAVCAGLKEARKQTIGEWRRDQQTAAHDKENEAFKAVTLHKFLQDGYVLDGEHRQMFFMACYNLDRFREFLFETTFLSKFVLEPQRVEALRRDDEALLQFAYEWVRFALFHERTLAVNHEYESAKRKVLQAD
jgi:uncharacterized protein